MGILCSQEVSDAKLAHLRKDDHCALAAERVQSGRARTTRDVGAWSSEVVDRVWTNDPWDSARNSTQSVTVKPDAKDAWSNWRCRKSMHTAEDCMGRSGPRLT